MDSGGGVNASIPLQAGVGVTPTPNPLQTIGQFADTKNALNQLQMFPQQQQLLEQQVQQAGIGTQQAQQNFMRGQWQGGWNALTPLLALPAGTIKIADATSALGAYEAAGGISQPVIADILQGAPPGDGTQTDTWFRARIAANSQENPAQAVQEVTPQAGSVDVGGMIQPTVTAPAGSPNVGTVTPIGGAFAKTISPDQANQLEQVWNPTTKQFDYVPRAQVAPVVNGAGQSTGPQTPELPQTPAVPGLPPTGRINNGAMGGPAATAPLGTDTALQASAQHLADARAQANNFQSTIFPIEGALTSLEGADTGKAGDTLQNIRGYLGDTPLRFFNQFLPSSLSDQDRRVAFDEAQKYTQSMALGAPGGSRSDQGLGAAEGANPNVHISNQAAVAVTKSILAQRRMAQAGTLAFNNSGLGAGDYDTFMNQWQTQQDPRAFIVDKLSPADRASLVQSMGGTGSDAYRQFKKSYLEAVQTGVLEGPGGGN
jgi:hypothetical protein